MCLPTASETLSVTDQIVIRRTLLDALMTEFVCFELACSSKKVNFPLVRLQGEYLLMQKLALDCPRHHQTQVPLMFP